MTDVFGQQDVSTTNDDYSTLEFVFWLLLQKVQTSTLVKVISCTNSGGLVPVGTVTVQPLVNQMTGKRQAVPHGELFNCLYSRITGGDNAVIMDPAPGDIGLMSFCSRDTTGVRANEGAANPGSFRMFDWADGVYMGGVPLGKTPSQYIRFAAGLVEVVSPTKITLRAPTVEIDAATLFTVAAGAVDIEATGDAKLAGATTEVQATGTATVQGAAITLAGPVSQTGGGASSFSGSLAAQGTDVHTHHHLPGTYVAGATPVTGNSGNPV